MASNSRSEQEAAFVAAVSAVVAVVEAREAAVQALTELADSLAAESETLDAILEMPFGKVLGYYHPQTFALFAEILSARAYLADSGAGSDFNFESLLTVEMRDISLAFSAWQAAEGSKPSGVDSLLNAFAAQDPERIAALLRDELEFELSVASAGGDDDA